MSDQRNGGIVWTEQTWNPLRGCTRVSAGCINCYAESMAARFCGAGQPYEGTINPETKRWSGNIKLVPEHLQDPLRWKRPRMVFVNSMSDLFHESVPDEFIDKVFAVMALASQHIFQVLTKRPERMRIYMNSPDRNVCIQNVVDDMESWDGNFIPSDQSAPLIKEWPLPNVWLGTTVENQEAADERIPLLLQTPATVRWISAEPMVGSVDLTKIPHRIGYGCSPCSGCDEAVFMDALSGATYCKTGCDGPNMPSIDWVVCGGESGTNARPMHPEWARSLRDQCAAAGVPFLFKQWGEWAPHQARAGGDEGGDLRRGRVRYLQGDGREPDGHFRRGDAAVARIGKKAAGRLLDGVLHDGYPEARNV